jgi:hypothetical protein
MIFGCENFGQWHEWKAALDRSFVPGIPVRSEEREVAFSVQGDCRLLGVDNGSNTSVQDYKSGRWITSQGRCLLVVQSTEQTGAVVVTATLDGLQSQKVELRIC